MHRTLSALICLSHRHRIGHFPSVTALTIARLRCIEESPICRAGTVRGTSPRSPRTRGSSAAPAQRGGDGARPGPGPGPGSASAPCSPPGHGDGWAVRGSGPLPRYCARGRPGTAAVPPSGCRPPGALASGTRGSPCAPPRCWHQAQGETAVWHGTACAAPTPWCVPRCLSRGLSGLGTAG